MKNKYTYILVIFIIFVFTMILFSDISKVMAQPLADAWNSAQNFGNSEKSDIINYENLHSVINFLYNLAMIIAITISVIIGIKIGVQIITGTVDQKADAKKLIVPYLVTVAFIAGAFLIWRILMKLANLII